MPSNPKPLPPDSREASNRRIFAQWLSDSSTRKFFRALNKKWIGQLAKAAANSVRTGIDNAAEHNRLVEANAIRKIIDEYANREQYPYDELDADEARFVNPGRREGVPGEPE